MPDSVYVVEGFLLFVCVVWAGGGSPVQCIVHCNVRTDKNIETVVAFPLLFSLGMFLVAGQCADAWR